ncbi:MAG: arylsulfotransferase family protein, partial [Candidatus Latescibacterota bacterium]
WLLSEVFNRQCLPDLSSSTGRLGNAAVLFFIIFLCGSFIARAKGKIMVIGSVILLSLIAIIYANGFLVAKSRNESGSGQIDQLKSLPYLDWVATGGDVGKTGVISHDSLRAFGGLNIYTSRESHEAYLIDMNGNLVHKWFAEPLQNTSWQHVELCANNDLLVVAKEEMLVRLDWNSRIRWQTEMRVHHDVAVDDQGAIFALAREDRLVFWHGLPIPIVGDYIAVLSPDGVLQRKVHIYDLVQERIAPRKIAKIYCGGILKPINLIKLIIDKITLGHFCKNGGYFDIMHTNSVEVLERDVEGFCKKGDWLLSLLELDLICVADPRQNMVMWYWGPGELSKQHHPTLLDNGNVLIFDNGYERSISRSVELDPLAKEIVWLYQADPPENFYSLSRGGNQRLPNGNTLITESDRGHVFEVEESGRIVWEYFNPEVRTEDKTRASIYRMMRVNIPGIGGPIK